MPKIARRIGRAAKDALREAELRILAAEGRKSVEAKVVRASRTARKAVKAGAIAGVATAVAVALRERRKRRALDR